MVFFFDYFYRVAGPPKMGVVVVLSSTRGLKTKTPVLETQLVLNMMYSSPGDSPLIKVESSQGFMEETWDVVEALMLEKNIAGQVN